MAISGRALNLESWKNSRGYFFQCCYHHHLVEMKKIFKTTEVSTFFTNLIFCTLKKE
jgi:hypothetical protein